MSKVNVFKRVLSDSSDLTKEVVKRIIDGDMDKLTDDIVDDVINVMEDTVAHGCASGCCSPFIYTNDNTDFLRDNLEEVFELLSDSLREQGRKYDVTIPWFIMTSEENNNDTINYILSMCPFIENQTNK